MGLVLWGSLDEEGYPITHCASEWQSVSIDQYPGRLQILSFTPFGTLIDDGLTNTMFVVKESVTDPVRY